MNMDMMDICYDLNLLNNLEWLIAQENVKVMSK